APTPRSCLLPYTTLFRSSLRIGANTAERCRTACALDRDQPIGAGYPAPERDLEQLALGGDRRAAEQAERIDRLEHGFMLADDQRSEEHTSELQSRENLGC